MRVVPSPAGLNQWIWRMTMAGGLVIGLCCRPAHAATPAEVANAITKAKAFIYSQQNPAGNWDSEPKTTMVGPAHLWGGHTALAAYALLAAGENPSDPKMARAIAFLENEDIDLTYALGLRDQALLLLPNTPEVRRLANKDAFKLLNGVDPHGRYGYVGTKVGVKDDIAHNSPSQYGVLGMWACDQLGAEVPGSYWQSVEEGWRICQGDDGAWSYHSHKPVISKNPDQNYVDGPKPSMTAAGVASLFITQEYLHRGADCHGNIDSPEIDRGMKWISDHFGEIAGGYTWYGIERISVAGGYKYIGAHNWYQEGAERIVRSQLPTGGWEAGGIRETSFNLVFLVRGRAPAVINKLKYNGHWNERPRDCFNYVSWMDRNIESRLNWQIVDLDSGLPADLNDAPILFISGDQPLNFTDGEKSKLRDFVQEGGLIVGNADCDRPEFSKSFIDLGKQLFPAYAFRVLPEDHPIYSNEQYQAAKWKVKPQVQSLSNGVRELMILPDTDLSRAFAGRNSVFRAAQYQLLNNIILYACDKTGLREKGQTYLVATNPAVPTTRTVKIARIVHEGNWDPEPYGWRQFAAVLHNGTGVNAIVEAVELGKGTLLGASPTPPTPQELRKQAISKIPPDQVIAAASDPAQLEALIQAKLRQMEADARNGANALPYPIAHITGTGSFTLTPPQRKELLEFADRGGTLIIDSAGGSSEFTGSAQVELSIIFGASAKEAIADPLPLSHALFDQPNAKIDTVTWRRYARERLVGALRAPRIIGIQRNGRIAAFFSREDLSAGLVGEPVDGVVGYDPATSGALMRNMILYGMGGK